MKRLVNIFWEIRYRILKKRWDRTLKNSRIDGRVLMFHHVTDEFVDTPDSCKCTVDVFKSVINREFTEKRNLISVDEMISSISARSENKFTVITFDDVPDDFYYNAYPFLKEHNVPFVLFITTDFIDKPGFLTKEQILSLDKDRLCTIGAHTVTHPMLRSVNNSLLELNESKRLLEELLGHSVSYMAYPFGRQSSVSQRIISEAEIVGYKCAFGTIQSPLTDVTSRNLFYLPRIVGRL